MFEVPRYRDAHEKESQEKSLAKLNEEKRY